MTDADLVPLAAAGDLAAFATLYRKHYSRVVRIATRATGSPHRGEDAASTVFLWLAQGRWRLAKENVPADGQLRAFICSLVRYAVLHCRDAHEWKHDPLPEPDEEWRMRFPRAKTPSPLTILLRKEQAQILRGAIGSLTKHERHVLRERAVEEKATADIGKAKNVVATMSGIRRKLRRRLDGVFDLPASGEIAKRGLYLPRAGTRLSNNGSLGLHRFNQQRTARRASGAPCQ
jgi:RNA polymerase sigma factor (sigma-70 family)